jgi:hypothetical protein
MVDYSCLRCGYIASQKINLKHHLQRKNVCKPILEDISIDEIKFMYGFEISSKVPQNASKSPHFSSKKSPQKSSKNPQKSSILKKNSSKILNFEDCKECSYCFKRFSRIDNFKRHLTTCKKKKSAEVELLEKKDNEIHELKEMVEKLLIETKGNTNISNSNNNSHNTTNNIININNYGDEDTKYITSDYILKLLKNRPAKTIPELIKYTHFNEEHPENQNIKITNKKEPYIKVRKNNKWELQDKDETITDLIDRQQIHLMDEDVEKKIDSSCNNSEKVNIERCTDLYNSEDKDYMKRLYNESELIIINNS